MKGCTTNTTFYPLVSNCTYILCLVIALHLITICTVRAQEIGPSKQNEVNLNDRFGSNTTDMVNLATGQVEFSVPLYSISKGSAAFSLNLYYSSTAVANDLRNNKNYNSGVIGVDWQLTESYFFREHNNTINLFDDKFYLSHNGQIIELLIIDHDENNKTISFNTELARPEKITYFYSVSDERWEILSTTGIISIFGGFKNYESNGYNKQSDGNSIAWDVAVLDHILPSNIVYDSNGERIQSQLACRWYLSKIADEFSNEIKLEYMPIERPFGGTGGNKVTKDLMLKKVYDQIGNQIELNYGSKDSLEYFFEDNGSIETTSFLNEFGSTKFLSTVKYFDYKQNKLFETNLAYETLLYGLFKRRFLRSIETIKIDNRSTPKLLFEYSPLGTSHAKMIKMTNGYGEIKTISYTDFLLSTEYNLNTKHWISIGWAQTLNDVGNGIVYSKLEDTDVTGNPLQAGGKVYVGFLRWENTGWQNYSVRQDDRLDGIIKYSHPIEKDTLNYSVYGSPKYIAVLKNTRHWSIGKQLYLYTIPDTVGNNNELNLTKFNFEVGNLNWGSGNTNGGSVNGNNLLQVVTGEDWIAIYGEQSGKLFLFRMTETGWEKTEATQRNDWIQHTQATNWTNNYKTVIKTRNGFGIYETKPGLTQLNHERDRIFYYSLSDSRDSWRQDWSYSILNATPNDNLEYSVKLTESQSVFSIGSDRIHLFLDKNNVLAQKSVSFDQIEGLYNNQAFSVQFDSINATYYRKHYLFNGLEWKHIGNQDTGYVDMTKATPNSFYWRYNGPVSGYLYDLRNQQHVSKTYNQINTLNDGGVFLNDYYLVNNKYYNLYKGIFIGNLSINLSSSVNNWNRPNLSTNDVIAYNYDNSGFLNWSTGASGLKVQFYSDYYSGSSTYYSGTPGGGFAVEFIGDFGTVNTLKESFPGESIRRLNPGEHFSHNLLISSENHLINFRKRVNNTFQSVISTVVSSVITSSGNGNYTTTFSYVGNELKKAGFNLSDKTPIFNKTLVRKGSSNGYSVYYHFTGHHEDAAILGSSNGYNYQVYSSKLAGLMFRQQIYNNSDELVSETDYYYHVNKLPGYANKTLYFPVLMEARQKNGLLNSKEKYEYEISANGVLLLRRSATVKDDGNGNILRNEIKYSYPTISTSLTLNQINLAIQTTTKYNNNYTSSVASSFRLNNGFMIPERTYQMINQTSVPPNFNNWMSGTPDPNLWQEVSSIIKYTAKGQPEISKDIDGKYHSIQYRLPDYVPIATFSNSTRLMPIQGSPHVGADASYLGFESGVQSSRDETNDFWDLYQPGLNDLVSPGSTGKYAVRVNKKQTTAVYGPTKDFLPSDQYGRYLVSCWVKTDAGFSTGNTWLKIHAKQNSENNSIYPAGAISSVIVPATNGQWKYISAILDLGTVRSGNTETLRIRTFIENQNVSYPVYVDDIRFNPVQSVSAVTVMDSVYNYPIASIGNNDEIVRYYYNTSNELIATEGMDGIVRHFSVPYFSRNGSLTDSYNSSDPNTVLAANIIDGGKFYSFNYNHTDWTLSGLSRVNGSIQDQTIANIGTLTYSLGTQADIGIRFELAHLSGSENYSLKMGQFTIVKSGNQWCLYSSGAQPVISTVTEGRAVTEWVGFILKNKLLFYADGKLIFTYVNSNQISGSIQIESGGVGTCKIDNVLIMKKPVLSMSYLNASGQVIQSQVLNDNDLIVSGPVYDEIGRPYVQPKPVKYDNSLFGLRSGYVTSFNGTTIAGDVVSQNPQDGGYPYTRVQFESSPLSRVIKTGLAGSDFNLYRSERPQSIYSENVIHGITDGNDRKNFLLSSVFKPDDGIYSTTIHDQLGRKLFDRVGPSTISSKIATVRSSNPTQSFFVNTNQTVSYSVSFSTSQSMDEGTMRKATFRVGTSPGAEDVLKITYQFPGSYPTTANGTFLAQPGINYYLSYDNNFTTDGLKISVIGSVTYTGEDYRTTKYEYDEFGRLSKLFSPNYFNLPRPDANPNDYVTSIAYDNRGRIVQKTSADEGYVKILQDNAGRIRFKLTKSGDKAANDEIMYFKYDDLNRLIEEGVITTTDWTGVSAYVENKSWPATPSTWRVKSEYDFIWNGTGYVPGKRGLLYRRLVNKDADNTFDVEESYVYDALNRLTSKKVKVARYSTNTYTTTFTYDGMSRLTRISYPGGHIVDYAYDHLNRVKTVGIPTDADYYADYTYDPVTGRLQNEKLANGGTQKITTYSYNSPGWLTSISNPLFTETASFTTGRFGDNAGYFDGKISKLSYSYNFTSNPRNYDVRMKYDSFGQLVTADYQTTNGTDPTVDNGDFGVPVNQPTVFDFHGNFLQVTKSTSQFVSIYGSGNQLASLDNQNTSEETSLTYNPDGAITNKTITPLSGPAVSMEFSFDYYTSRVLSGQKKVSGTTQYTVNLTYDSEGFRALKEVQTGSTTDYLLSLTAPGGSRLEERKRINSGTESVKSYIYGATGLLAIRSSSVDYFVIKDRLNSTRIVFKGTDGTVVSRFDYAPYGEVIRSLESGDLVSFTYTGQEMDKHLGVMNYNARLYDPGLSRFLSADPLREFHSPYNYVGNNPFSFTDPSGMGSVPREQDLTVEPFRLSSNATTFYSGDLTGGSNTPGAESVWELQRWANQQEIQSLLAANSAFISKIAEKLNIPYKDAEAYFLGKRGNRSIMIDEVNAYLRYTMSDEYMAILAEEAERRKRDFNEFDIVLDFGFLVAAWDKTMPASVFVGIAGVEGSLFSIFPIIFEPIGFIRSNQITEGAERHEFGHTIQFLGIHLLNPYGIGWSYFYYMTFVGLPSGASVIKEQRNSEKHQHDNFYTEKNANWFRDIYFQLCR